MTNDELFVLEDMVTKLIEYTKTVQASADLKEVISMSSAGILRLCHKGRTSGKFTRDELHELLNWANGLLAVVELFLMTKFMRDKLKELGCYIINLVAEHHQRLLD